MKETFNCILFDGEKLNNNVKVTIENGKYTSIEKNITDGNIDYFMMPCLIDAHTHMNNIEQVNKMLSYGIGATLDVSAPISLIESSNDFEIISSIDMAMGIVLNPKKLVQNAIKKKARYIKVLLFNSLSIGFKALKGIVEESHKNNLKVVVHATEIATYKQAVDCGADIILHLPMKDELPDELAKKIANKGIYVVPTLVMMETFSKSGKNGYEAKHFINALKQVETLYKNGVKILVGTDANMGNFAPKVSYGDSLYHEINLLLKANIPLTEVLKGSTSYIQNAFNIYENKIQIQNDVNALLFHLKDNNIELNYNNLKHIWIKGKNIK